MTDELVAALRARIDDLARALLGDPNKAMSSKRELRFGSKGALCVWIAGPKRGGWADFSGDAKGSPLGLIRFAQGCEFWPAVTWARAWLGWPDDDGNVPDAPAPRPEPPPADEAPVDDAADAERRAEIARRFWHDSGPVRGTVGERYLIDVRKIPAPSRGWPEAVRFHRNTRSLILAATTADDTVRAVQMVRLTPSARVVQREDGGKLKITRGSFAGVAVRLPSHQAAGALLLAEGPETGLSVWRATGCETWVLCGSMSRIDAGMLPRGRMVIVCADDDLLNHPDPRKLAAARALAKAVQAWRAAGVWLAVATPSVERRQDKSDFNDLLQASGLAAVRARLVAIGETMAAERRAHALRGIARAIDPLLLARRPSAEIFAEAERVNAECGAALLPDQVRKACTDALIDRLRRDGRRRRRVAA
ncbi:MAG: toprim domain-containing protein [Acetobacteraceae bacterium]